MNLKIKYGVGVLGVVCFGLTNLLAQFSYTNNNPAVSTVPYGGTFTYSVTWGGGTYTNNSSTSAGVLLQYLKTPSSQINYNMIYPTNYTFSYTINGINASNDGNYFLALYYETSYGGPSTTIPVTLNISPAILTQPQNTVCVSGSSTTMGIAAGPNTATFQWFNAATGNSINSAGNSPVFTPTLANNGERVYCQISNNYGSVSSSSVVLSVGTAPSVSSQTPTNVFATLGSSVTFSVTSAGTLPLNYQWYDNGISMQGANLNYITISAASNANAGVYQVIITNLFGQAASSNINLSVGTSVAISNQPVSLSVTQGQSATFSVSASGSSPLHYQWTRNGSVIANATSSSYTFVNALASNDGNTFAVIVTNFYSSVNSSNAILTVLSPVTIVQQPVCQCVLAGSNAVFSVIAEGTPPIFYQWLKNGTNLTDSGNLVGSISNILTLALTTTNDTGAYSVTVNNLYGTNTSVIANLLVGLPPQNLILIYTNNSATLQMAGTVGFNYAVQTTTNLTPPVVWQSVATNAADTNGNWIFNDTNASLYPAQFYRATVP